MGYTEGYIRKLFQSTPLREGRPARRPGRCRLRPVSIHAPSRGATIADGTTADAAACFNPRPFARGDATAAAAGGKELLFQSTPLREGRPADAAHAEGAALVSIHAPSRGATTSASTNGASSGGFNPRPFARGDLTIVEGEYIQQVSIHAPSRGATEPAHGHLRRNPRFNPRPFARGDRCSRSRSAACKCFNPRPFARGDLVHPSV